MSLTLTALSALGGSTMFLSRLFMTIFHSSLSSLFRTDLSQISAYMLSEPSSRSIRGCRMPSAAVWTSDLEIACPCPPPFTSYSSLPVAITETSTRRLKLR